MPILHLLAGPNGSGKSTYVRHVIAPIADLPFVKADVIAAARWPQAQLEHAYDASRAAEGERQRLLADRKSFISETVFSHRSKVDLVGQAVRLGYIVHLHVLLIPVELSVARVADRVSEGGHDVPERKIRERYDRLWSLIAQARGLADRTEILDNSSAATPFRVVATYEHGELVGTASWPTWTPAALGDAAGTRE
ncbi:putative ABC-type ATPase [Kineosphaera limosa]|uniref:Uncharacterized protein n=1 Tax=Kineosphaera limosa NBRC 100340 TaxID=1184609 RepID=K6XEY4_9MICO|nr:zeta toxin family protein [Kineosphaera limosa]NYE00631.1 putative ABC-type ATPase [Kineosphaera limosa]GAB97364.1 hypothetical protein KILIM_066_00050 [Kineosphaera limosa NBRC 100340]